MASFILIAVLALALVGAVAYITYAVAKKRREAFATMARQLGLSYAAKDPFNVIAEPFALFEKGDGRGAENMLWGTWQSLELRAFDYWYYEESTDSHGRTSRNYYRFDCAIVPIDAACVRLTITHETLFTRLADALTFHDIEFESEAFNKAYNVKSADKKFANDLIDARMMSWLLAHGDGYSFEVVGEEVLCYCKKIQPAAFLPLLGTAKAFLDTVPKVVTSLYPRSSG
ncbi:MAG: hypothetical protein M3P11_09985 [Actinomycetota bacterium]|nr:hypothetical protein [Actinomycetota bacterium]